MVGDLRSQMLSSVAKKKKSKNIQPTYQNYNLTKLTSISFLFLAVLCNLRELSSLTSAES